MRRLNEVSLIFIMLLIVFIMLIIVVMERL